MFFLLKKKKYYEIKNDKSNFILNIYKGKQYGYKPDKTKKTIIDFIYKKI